MWPRRRKEVKGKALSSILSDDFLRVSRCSKFNWGTPGIFRTSGWMYLRFRKVKKQRWYHIFLGNVRYHISTFSCNESMSIRRVLKILLIVLNGLFWRLEKSFQKIIDIRMKYLTGSSLVSLNVEFRFFESRTWSISIIQSVIPVILINSNIKAYYRGGFRLPAC